MKKNNELEFSALIEGNQGIIHKVCRLYTNNDEDSQDLFQEIVLQLWKSYKTFKGNSKFTTWMYRVALNTAITLFRKSSRKIETQEIDHSLYKISDDNDFSIKQEQINFLYESIKKLSEIERAIILLYLEDLPYKEISETLGITEVNARVKINRIKVKLKDIMSKNE
ncbi:RNA polymerase sigma factor [Apibacter muscae]|uniref:RNA polymerase sigma factor n=1 Tax=Apibacter muscae TaxID=2509004 RepID=UPI0011ABD0BF|nr:RNA polymerase sigma factor [Apibacter muscae]TWP23002.1 RNA polymerase sigma factor [Apibacter muscae]TWP27955.1 RNA polymerase sigma factor [Apibacter muscae]